MTGAATTHDARVRPAVSPGAALALDAVLLVLFAWLGRRSHDEATGVAGVFETAWPFLLGAGLGWAVAWTLFRRAPVTVRDGVLVWLGALVGGMLLRVLTGAGTAVTFILVAGATTALFLLGWRALAALAARRARA